MMSNASENKVIKYFSWTLFILVLGASFSILFLIIFFRSLKYNELINRVLNELHREDLRSIITTKFFSKNKFDMLQYISLPILLVVVVLIVLLIQQRRNVFVFFSLTLQRFHRKWKAFTNVFIHAHKQEKAALIVLVLIVAVRSVYNALYYPIQYDEAFNYNYFLHKNILYTVVAYNNYPLHNIISWLLIHSINSSLFIQRLPSIIAGIAFLLALYATVKKVLNVSALPIIVICLVAFSPVYTFYSLYARGVMFNMVFTTLLFYYLVTRINTLSLRTIMGLSVLNALALYSMVSHVYFIAMSTVFIWAYSIKTKNRSHFKLAILYFLCSMFLSSLLLLPMYLGTGLDLGLKAAVSNQSLSYKKVFEYILSVDYFFTGFRYVYFFIFFSAIFFVLRKSEKFKNIALLSCSLLLILFFVPAFTSILPPERSMSFVFLSYVYMSALILFFLMAFFNRIIIYTALFILCLLSIYRTQTHNFLNWSYPLDKSAKQVAQLFLENGINECYCMSSEFSYYAPAILYYYLRNDKYFSFNTNNKLSTRYSDYNKSSCSCIVIDKKDIESTKALKGNYKKFYEFNEFVVWLKN